MEELFNALGIKQLKDKSLDEIRTQAGDYENFLSDLEELSEIINSQIFDSDIEVFKSRLNAKLGEISFMLENDLSGLLERETEILHQMACHEASTHFEDYMNPPQESREPDEFDEIVHDNMLPDGTHQCECDVLGTCPFDAYGSDDCRRYCGLGVDE